MPKPAFSDSENAGFFVVSPDGQATAALLDMVAALPVFPPDSILNSVRFLSRPKLATKPVHPKTAAPDWAKP